MAWFDKVSIAVAKILCACFNLDPESQEAAYRFVPAYTKDETTPQAPTNKDVVYYALSEMQGSGFDYIQQKTRQVGKNVMTQIQKTIPVSVLLTFYGSHADDDAELFWSMFQWDSGADSPRAILRGERIVPIGLPDRPVSLFEVEGTFHRRRCDVRLNLAYLDISEHQASAVTEPPEIQTVTQV
ncbi:MAG: hypothetical protein J6Y20_00625 [Lachnospiraceae bacterium]|nr:hypothetical protein [Lachnospiraceae bacterium]